MEKKKWIICFLMAIAFIFSPILLADESNSTHSATVTITVTVSDRSEIALKSGLQAAFSEAILEMSNDVQITSQPIVKAAMLHVKQWVQSYSYADAQNTSTPKGVTPILSLQVIFYRYELEKLIQQAQNPTHHPLIETNTPISLYISGVHNVSDYSQIVQALKSNKIVRAVEVKNMDANSVLLDVMIAGNANDLAHDLSQDNHFIAMNNETNTHTTADLYYRWTQSSIS